jgi:outer membrane protein TolC
VRWLALIAWLPAWLAAVEPLRLPEVLTSVKERYPPLLIAMIEQDVAAGRLRQADGAFDLGFSLRAGIAPQGYYDGSSGDVALDQRLPFWGANVFAGYRRSSGLLADYDKDRTQRDGEFRAGLRFNLLRDGPIDRQRAERLKARLDVGLADPFIERQQLDIIRTATRSYYNWAAAGLREAVARDQLKVAEDRASALTEQSKKGMVAPIVVTDNERLIVSRQLIATQARRRFEAAALELSLFYRGPDDQPITPARERLPKDLPVAELPERMGDVSLLEAVAELRPELRRVRLLKEKVEIDLRLARNATLPNLDLTFGITRNQGDGPYNDVRRDESRAGLEFRLPIQRNEALGRTQVSEAELRRLEQDLYFVRDRIRVEVKDGWSALAAAHELLGAARRNVELSDILVKAEQTRFKQGATDLLALQIREQALLEAQFSEVTAQADFFTALADYRAAIAADLKK